MTIMHRRGFIFKTPFKVALYEFFKESSILKKQGS